VSKQKKDEQSIIPKLDLEKFEFSPPGPMGWSFSEYEQMLDNLDSIVLDQNTVKEQLSLLEGKELVELSMDGVSSNYKLSVNAFDTLKKFLSENLNVDVIEVEVTVSSPRVEKIMESNPLNNKDELMKNSFDYKDELMKNDLDYEDEIEIKKEEIKSRVRIVKVDEGIKNPWISPVLSSTNVKKGKK